MTTAAAVITPAVVLMPWATAAWVETPWSYASRMRLRMKTALKTGEPAGSLLSKSTYSLARCGKSRLIICCATPVSPEPVSEAASLTVPAMCPVSSSTTTQPSHTAIAVHG